MPLRFRRRVKIFQGIYLNLGKNGISTTIGPRGANINIGKNGVYLNTGIPGTGLSNRENLLKNYSHSDSENHNTPDLPVSSFGSDLNKDEEIVTSHGLEGLKDHLEESKKERLSLGSEIKDIQKIIQELQENFSKKKNGLFSMFTKKETLDNLEQEINENTQSINELKKQYEDSKADINIQLDSEHQEQYKKLSTSFNDLINSNKIWDITTEIMNPELRSTAKSIVERKEVKFKIDSIDFIKSDYSAFHLENANGSDMYIYPAFLLLVNKQGEITLIDLKDLKFSFREQRFQEQSATLPIDSKIIDYTWYKANKDGSRDLRFVGNYQIPVVKYGVITFNFGNGLSETYYVSNFEIAQNFGNEFEKYLNLLNYPSKSVSQNNNQNYLPNLIKPLTDSLDPLTSDAATLIVATQSGSTSLLQRRMKLGYNRAGRIMDQLEKLGIVGPNLGSTVREVLIRDPDSLQVIFKNYEDHILSKTNLVTPIFTKEYYDLLVDFSPKITEIVKKLETDELLIDKLKDTIKGISTGDFIQFCILYDFYQILKIINEGKIDPTGLEAFGFLLLSGKIMEKLSALALSMDYETLKITFSKGTQKEVVESVIKLAEVINPLKINIQCTDNNKITSSRELQNNLCLTTALKVINDSLFDEYATTLYQFANIISKADSSVSKEEEDTLKEIYQVTHNPISAEENKSLAISDVSEKETLDEVLNELETLIGLDNVKKEVKSLINYIKIQKEREKLGLKSSQVSYHCVFTGSPGTGKTTVARIVAKIYMHLGILKKGHLVETDRSGLIAEYSGQTAVKVNKTVDSALDGVLFIDEAYSMIGENKDDFGKEAVATLIKRMEDDRDKLIVILAGYTEEMKKFIETNPGLKSRFNRYIEFADYTASELAAIFELNCSKLDYKLTDDADKKLFEIMSTAFANRDKSFGNGRFARNLFEKTIENQANRIAGLPTLTKEILTTIEKEDIEIEPTI